MALKTSLPLVIIAVGVLYQLVLKDILFIVIGIGRTVQPIEDFPYDCHRVHHPLLESCEDLWLDDKTGVVYAACSDPVNRAVWSPAINQYQTTERKRTDHIAVLNPNEPGRDGLHGVHQLVISGGYKSADRDRGSALDLLGFDVQELDDSRLRFWMINHRPPVNATSGEWLDAGELGANSTIEVFETARGSSLLKYIKTIASEAFTTPNNLVALPDGGLLVTNDHTCKVGRFRELELLTGGGSISYCGADGHCHFAATKGFYFPNGITKGTDGLYYVAHSAKGKVTVHALQADHILVQVDEIKLGISVDNLSIDADGDIFGAAFPDVLKLPAAINAPLTTKIASTVLRIRKTKNKSGGSAGYEVMKVLEDKDGKVMPVSTVAVHDAKTGRLILGGGASHFITICERRR